VCEGKGLKRRHQLSFGAALGQPERRFQSAMKAIAARLRRQSLLPRGIKA